MEFVVDRKTWFRGQGSVRSRLLTEDGTKCCLGFLALQCGYTEAKIKDRETPFRVALPNQWSATEIPEELKSFPEFLFHGAVGRYGDSYVAIELMEINDDQGISDTVRELLLIAKFAEQGINLRFEN